MNIKLIPFSKKHLEFSRRWMNDKEICRLFNRTYKPLSVAAQQSWFKKIMKDETQLILAIETRGVYVGNVGLKSIDLVNKKCEFYIFIGDKEYWGKGIGTEATKIIIDRVKKMKIHKIYLHVDETNLAARKMYQKTGFVEEGILKDELLRSGKYINMIRMALFL